MKQLQLEWTLILLVVMMGLSGASPPLNQADRSVSSPHRQGSNMASSSQPSTSSSPLSASPDTPASLGILETDRLASLALQFATQIHDAGLQPSHTDRMKRMILDVPRLPEIWVYLPLLSNVRIHAVDDKGQPFDLVRFTKATLWRVPFDRDIDKNLKSVCYVLQPFGDYYLVGPVTFNPQMYTYARLMKLVPLYRFIGVRLVIDYTGRTSRQIRVLEFDIPVDQKSAEESHRAATEQWARLLGPGPHS